MFEYGDKVTDRDGFKGIVQDYPYRDHEESKDLVSVRFFDGRRVVGESIRSESELTSGWEA